MAICIAAVILAVWTTCLQIVVASSASYSDLIALERPKCINHRVHHGVFAHSEFRHRVRALRDSITQLQRSQSINVSAYIVTSHDDHFSEWVDACDRRIEFLSGFTGDQAIIAVTKTKTAIWVQGFEQTKADAEVDCDWQIFNIEKTSVTNWLLSELYPDSTVGGDARTVPHFQWQNWQAELWRKFIRLVKVHQRLVEDLWHDRPPPNSHSLHVHRQIYAGEKWQSKVTTLRAKLAEHRCDAIVLTSLTEIAYILNVRGADIPYTPVFKAYLIVARDQIMLYTNITRIEEGVKLHLNADICHRPSDSGRNDIIMNCVQLMPYHHIWRDLRDMSNRWSTVWIPQNIAFDLGASEAITAAVPRKEKVLYRPSPVIFQRAIKNDVERVGMKNAHIRDGAAMCEALAYLEERLLAGDTWTEQMIAKQIDRARYAQPLSQGSSIRTVVASGKNGASLNYELLSNSTDTVVSPGKTLIIESGGQYLDGTTIVARTLHFGEPTREQRRAYTNVLAGIIRLSSFVFPEILKPSEFDSLARSFVWSQLSDYPHGTGHSIGSYLSVRESPIQIKYSSQNNYTFNSGYYFSSEPGFYKGGSFGIRLKNVLQVMNTGEMTEEGAKFLAFDTVTLVPYEPKLIDRAMLSMQEKRWINVYNSKVRELIGMELKRQNKMHAFYWMMNKTRYVIEYLPEEEYRQSLNVADSLMGNICVLVLTLGGAALLFLNY